MRNEVRQRLHAANMTQQGLAVAAGVSRQTTISVEQGRYRPSVALALVYAAGAGLIRHGREVSDEEET